MRRTVLLALALVGACDDDVLPGPADGGGLGGPDAETFRPLAAPPFSPPPNLFGVWGRGTDDLYLVGERGTILHWDGQAFQIDTTSTSADLRSIWGRETGRDVEIYAVGTGGTILSLVYAKANPDGTPAARPTRWTKETSPTRVDLNAVRGSGGRVIAVGASGVIVTKEDMGPFTRVMDSGSLEQLNGVWVSGDQAVAVGNLGTVLRFDGAAWTRQRITGLTVALRGVWGPAADRLTIVGLDGTILRSQDDTFAPLEGAPRVNLRDLVGHGGRTFFVGWGGTIGEISGDRVDAWLGITENRLESIWATTVDEPVDAGSPGVDGGFRSFARFYVAGVSGVVLYGPE